VQQQPQPLTETGSCSRFWKSEHVAIQSWAKRLTSDSCKNYSFLWQSTSGLLHSVLSSTRSLMHLSHNVGALRHACGQHVSRDARSPPPPHALLRGAVTSLYSMKFQRHVSITKGQQTCKGCAMREPLSPFESTARHSLRGNQNHESISIAVQACQRNPSG